MGDDQAPNRMNLDLNLGPFTPATPPPPTENDPASDSFSVNLEDWIGANRLRRDAHRIRVRSHWRSIQGQIAMPIPLETRRSTGEGSGPAEPIKVCDNSSNNNNNVVHVDDDKGDDKSGRKEDDEKADQGSFFDCNICLDLSVNPVVTCCGHLFCWTCLYQWLHFHSDAKECPVCKGEVTIKTVTPIYGRGMISHELEADPTLKIPARPQAHRVESWRQTIERNAFTFPVEEMIRRLGNRYDLNRDVVQAQPNERNNNNNTLLDRFLTSRGLRREHNNHPPDDVIDLTESSSATNSNSETVDGNRRVHPMLRRQPAQIIATTSQTSIINSSAERVRRMIVRVTHNSNMTSAERNQEHHHHPLSGEDRDSVSSIAAVIHSGSQMVDNAIEIDSNVFLSTSSSRRRQGASRVSDMDSGDSRPSTRRRRIN